MTKVVRGVDTNEDLEPWMVNKEVRLFRYIVKDVLVEHGGFLLVIYGLIVAFIPFIGLASYSEILLVFGLMLFAYIYFNEKKYRFGTPVTPETKNKDGIFLIGNENKDNSEVWFTNDEMRTHMLIFGSTGSGKTRTLLGILYQALLTGSGALYVDGKADNTVFWLFYSLVRRLGREDDLLVINYLTGGASTENNNNWLNDVRKSNTTNPFSFGSSETLRSLIVGLMRDGGGDDMWKGRSSAMLAALLKTLVYLRDQGVFDLDVEKIREYFPLDRMVELAYINEGVTTSDDLKGINIPEAYIEPLRNYLKELPGFDENKALEGDFNPKVTEQHGYLIMQLTEVMADLSETYAHIFKARLGEVDFRDVVFNRRILFVMLPALEKDPDALAGLGKLVVAGVRSALAPALGDTIEGTKTEVIDQKPTNANVPFIMILDEYGYYAVKGFAVVAAQARSLGVGVVFAGQDYPSFKKGSEEEAASTVANTNIKICMKLEDPSDTFDIIQKRAGESLTAKTEGHEVKKSGGTGMRYVDQQRTRIESKQRVNLRDLVEQKPGEMHVFFGDKIARCRAFYADPYEVNEAKINKFIMISKPKRSLVQRYNKSLAGFDSIFFAKQNLLRKNKTNTDNFNRLLKLYKAVVNSGVAKPKAAIIAFSLLSNKSKVQIKHSTKPSQGNHINDEKEALNGKNDKPLEIKNDKELGSGLDLLISMTEEKVSVDNNFFNEINDIIEHKLSSKGVAESTQDMYRADAQLKSIANKELGKSSGQIEKEIDILKDCLNQESKYPSKPFPDKIEKSRLQGLFDGISNKVHDDES